jgi:hypothetical protein
MRAVAPLLFPMFLVASSLGCAAAKSTYHLVEAEQALKGADESRADELAVYEYTMATRYLEKAREESQYAEYKVSVQLARKSAQWSDRAIITIQREGRDLDLDGFEDLPDDLPAADPSLDDDLLEDAP